METGILKDERQLLDRIAGGDEQAFTVVFDHYCHGLGLHLYRLTKSTQVAEEIVQDVFLKIWIAREALKEVRDFKAYLFIASKNHALNAIKKAAKDQQKQKAFETDTRLFHSGIDEREGIEEQYYSLLDQAIERLPQQQKKVFILARKQRMKYEEVAQEMNISKESVKKYLQHATRSISEYVRDNMDPALIALLLLSEFQLHQMTVS